MNDGLLANDVAQYYKMSYREAVKAIEGKVAEIRQTIEAKGEYNICGVGRLHADNTTSYAFEPLPCGISAPLMYGLDSIYASTVEQQEESRPRLTVTKKDQETLTLKVSMNLVRYAAVVAVATVFFFICMAPLSTAITQERSEAGMFHQLWTMVTEAINTPSTRVEPMAKAETKTATKKKVEHKIEKKVVQKPIQTPVIQEEVVPKPEPMPYTIVLASAITETNAAAAVETLHQAGHNEARVLKRGKMVRVVHGSYTTEDEAREALRELRDASTDFAEAWIYEIPE